MEPKNYYPKQWIDVAIIETPTKYGISYQGVVLEFENGIYSVNWQYKGATWNDYNGRNGHYARKVFEAAKKRFFELTNI